MPPDWSEQDEREVLKQAMASGELKYAVEKHDMQEKYGGFGPMVLRMIAELAEGPITGGMYGGF
jgi:hypothetical protein